MFIYICIYPCAGGQAEAKPGQYLHGACARQVRHADRCGRVGTQGWQLCGGTAAGRTGDRGHPLHRPDHAASGDNEQAGPSFTKINKKTRRAGRVDMF